MRYEVVIGLEVHAQLKTKSKIFCSCSTEFCRPGNVNTCPICLGMPGSLPVLNKKAVEYAIRAGLATHCRIEPLNRFARKNYFYPDLPKGYQISQYELPLATKGYINIRQNGAKKKIGLTRIHMEEDAGKLIHGENLGHPDKSYADFNRAGVPLVEIVSEPDIRSPEEAREYLTELKSILEYTDVCDCNMEEGSLRCDANVSLRPPGQKEFGTRAEIKNINSFRFVQKALEYEIERQTKILDRGEKVIQETRLYNSAEGVTYSMRSKEEAHDYRYFPEPDLVPIVIDEKMINEIRKTLPELPEQKRERFIREYEIPEYDAGVLTASQPLAGFYEKSIRFYNKPKVVSNWIMGELLRELKNDERGIEDCPITPKTLADMLALMDNGVINGKIAKTVFEEMYRTGKTAEAIVQEKGLTQITDEGKIIKIIEDVMVANPAQLNDYRNGKDKLFGFFVGQVMKATQGQANPAAVNQLLKEKLGDSSSPAK
ncbi:MAG: aspartyl/glutamyl-tRNA amidotransferase subunit B [Nitrospinae bacterium RIFCSPLOWO2_12_FULL_47_7]|nr:MAG: aspartyl/glutamyl-tRNA amidotransferase subunit B [Nitrospinae bacterium RIFCSPLOWO2_12_FULL_47_7]